jgi:hypothetical protein
MAVHRYTIELTDLEQKGMEYITTDVDAWIQNAVHERARIAIEEIVATDVAEKLSTGQAISGTKEDIAMSSTLPNARTRNENALRDLPTANNG